MIGDGGTQTGSKPAPFIEVAHLSYAYPREKKRWTLTDIDTVVRRDEYLLIAGASGSGKSTLCRTFNGLIPHFYGGRMKGWARVNGVNTACAGVKDLFDAVGMVFQNPAAQLFNRTVSREIAFGLESLGLPRDEMPCRIKAVSRQLELEDLLERHPHSLSGGQQQLVCIAAILALAPGIIVLDEPFANLDPSTVFSVKKSLRKIHRQGTGVVLSEHRLRDAARDADRMIIVDDGRIVADDQPETLLTSAVTEKYGLTTGWRSGTSGFDAGITGRPKKVFRKRKALLAVENVSYQYGSFRALDSIDFLLRSGECLALVGANGAGKTTLLKHLNGLLRPIRGRVLLGNADTAKMKTSRLARHVGMVFQNPAAQFFKLTVEEELAVGPRALGRVDDKWMRRLIDLFRLSPLLKRSPFRLSSGEKKRVAIAAALACRPDVLVLDEPTAGQDGLFQCALGAFLAELEEEGLAVIMATHDMDFAGKNAHRWLVMAGGRIVAQGAPHEIFDHPEVMEKAGLRPGSSNGGRSDLP